MADPTAAASAWYVLGVLFLATLIRSTLGFGEALVAVPLLALRVPIVLAAPLAELVSVVVAGVVVVQDRRRVDWRTAAGLVLWALPGIPLGIGLLVAVSDRWVKLALGTLIVAFAVYALLRRGGPPDGRPGPGWVAGCGLLSGVLGGAYGMNGPPLAVYGARRGWSPQQFRATLQGYFLPASVAGLIGYAASGVWSPLVTRYLLLSLPGVAVAIVLGRAINGRVKGQGFFRCVYAGLIVVGAVLAAQAAFPPPAPPVHPPDSSVPTPLTASASTTVANA